MERLSDLTAQMKNQTGRYTAGRFLQSLAVGKGEAGNAMAFAESSGNGSIAGKSSAPSRAAVSPIDTGDFPGALVPVADSFPGRDEGLLDPAAAQGLRRVPMLTRSSSIRPA